MTVDNSGKTFVYLYNGHCSPKFSRSTVERYHTSQKVNFGDSYCGLYLAVIIGWQLGKLCLPVSPASHEENYSAENMQDIYFVFNSAKTCKQFLWDQIRSHDTTYKFNCYGRIFRLPLPCLKSYKNMRYIRLMFICVIFGLCAGISSTISKEMLYIVYFTRNKHFLVITFQGDDAVLILHESCRLMTSVLFESLGNILLQKTPPVKGRPFCSCLSQLIDVYIISNRWQGHE